VLLQIKKSQEIKSLLIEYQAAGAIFAVAAAAGPRAFIVKGPDGNLPLFAGPAE
jgi:hypothetical protein